LATGPDFEVFAYRPDTRADALLVGCLLAILASRGVLRRSRRAPAAAAACVLGVTLPFGGITSSYTIGPVAVASAVLVWWAAGAASTFLSWGPLRGLGRISYGLYLWHMPVAGLVLTANRGPTFSGAALIYAASISLALASWFLVEQPMQAGRQTGRPCADGLDEHRAVRTENARRI
jgi:peptidoglycan/LPS O-acetylase OafA/YrhL